MTCGITGIVGAAASNLGHDSARKIRVRVIDARIRNGNDLRIAVLLHTHTWIALARVDT